MAKKMNEKKAKDTSTSTSTADGTTHGKILLILTSIYVRHIPLHKLRLFFTVKFTYSLIFVID
jgi:hypothetical protein